MNIFKFLNRVYPADGIPSVVVIVPHVRYYNIILLLLCTFVAFRGRSVLQGVRANQFLFLRHSKRAAGVGMTEIL